MKAALECLACVAAQAVRAARFASDDPQVQRRILDQTVAMIPGMDLDASPAVLSNPPYEIAARESGNPDPYAAMRREQNAFALELEPELRAIIRDSADPIRAALHLAAAGNVIDVGAQGHDIDVHGAIAQAMTERFAVDHTDALLDALAPCRDLLYLLDNAGEIVFDKILIEALLEYTPVTAVVKAGPIINDVLRGDAEQVGLTDVCEVIDNGVAHVGSPLTKAPRRFLERMAQADVIVGKGQGNYETIDVFPGNVFLILRAKCATIAAHMGVRPGQVALISTQVRNRSPQPS